MNRSMVTVLAVLAVPTGAAAQPADFPGDPEAGANYARIACANCHRISPHQPLRDATGPGFQEIAAKPETTAMSLLAWLTSVPHPTMPNLIIPPEDAKNVVAYILSLRGR